MIYVTFSQMNEIYVIKVYMTLYMNIWKNIKNIWKIWLKEVIWNLTILDLNTSQDASCMSRNAWKMTMINCNDLEKVSWSYTMKRYDIVLEISKSFRCQSIDLGCQLIASLLMFKNIKVFTM